MEALVKDGLVRSIGLFNADIAQVQQVLAEGSIAPAVNSVEVHPHCRNTELVDFCKSKVGPLSVLLGTLKWECLVLSVGRYIHLH